MNNRGPMTERQVQGFEEQIGVIALIDPAWAPGALGPIPQRVRFSLKPLTAQVGHL
jgi:hypothetical protein